VKVCKELIAKAPHTLSDDGKFSWEEVECMGACANAPMAQIGKDYYEDLTPETLRDLIGRFSVGDIAVPGPQNGRYAAEPKGGLTSLKEFAAGRPRYNASAQAAVDLHDTIRRIDGTEVPLTTPWLGRPAAPKAAKSRVAEPRPSAGQSADAAGVTVQGAKAKSKGKPKTDGNAPNATPVATAEAKALATPGKKPAALKAARKGKADDLKLILGIGPKLEALCHRLGFFHFDQIAAWTEDEIAWVDQNLEGFKGRVTRDRWVAQAKILANGGSVEEAERAAKA
jgi:NADH-quinone oxidoreductase subunit E